MESAVRTGEESRLRLSDPRIFGYLISEMSIMIVQIFGKATHLYSPLTLTTEVIIPPEPGGVKGD